jgi:hypothetical protein
VLGWLSPNTQALAPNVGCLREIEFGDERVFVLQPPKTLSDGFFVAGAAAKSAMGPCCRPR